MNKKLYFSGILILTILIFTGLVMAGEIKAPKNGKTYQTTYDGITHLFEFWGPDEDGDGYIDQNEDGSYSLTPNTKFGNNAWWKHPEQTIIPGPDVYTNSSKCGELGVRGGWTKYGNFVVQSKIPGGPWKKAYHVKIPKGATTRTAPIPGPGPGPNGPVHTLP